MVVDALGSDLGPTATLQCLFHTEHERSIHSDQQAQQDAADRQARPPGLAEDAVIAMELLERGQPRLPQRRRDRAAGWRQEAAREQHLNMGAHVTGEHGRERQQTRQDRRQRV